MKKTTEKKLGMDFTEGAVMPLLIRFLIPFLLANILNSIYNTVDTIVIGQFVGSSGIVAVSMGGKVMILFDALAFAMASGGQTLISQLVGARKKNDLNSAIGTLFSSLFILSCIMGALMFIFSGPLLGLFNTPADSWDQAVSYLRIICIGTPLMFGYTTVSSVLRGEGDSKSPLVYIAIAAVVNVVGDLVLVAVFHMGAAGTAIATVLGQGISFIFSIVKLYKCRAELGFDFRLKSFAIDLNKLKVIVRIGLPTSFRAIFINVFTLVIMGYINEFGVASAAAYSVADKIYSLSYMFMQAVNTANAGMIAQNIGAGNIDRVKLIMRATLKITIPMAALFSLITALLPKFIFSLFTSDSAVIEMAPPFMYCCCLLYFISVFMGLYDGVITGTGASFLSMFGGILDGVIFKFGFGLLLAYTLGMGVVGFYLGSVLARLGPLAVGAIYYHTGAWKKKKKLI